jgi:protein-export membrane protein SecD/preprotein translocase SecF subunit
MKELRWKILKCLFPVFLGILVIGVAWYNYSNPPLKVGNLTLSRLKFKLGVDLVGGTILVYEIDPDKPKPEDYKKDQLISALKRRLDPADLYNITIRPLSDTRVEIILPTGGKHQLEAQNAAWKALLDAAATKWGLDREQLTARRGELAELTQQIRRLKSDVSDKELDDLFKEHWGEDQKALTGDDVARIKDLIQRVGSLDFRILANRSDDKDAFEEVKRYFDKAATAWREFVDKVRGDYRNIEKGGEREDSETYENIAFGDEAGLRALVKKRHPDKNPKDVDAWFERETQVPLKVPEYRELVRSAEQATAPKPPIGASGAKFTITLKDGEHKVKYSWVELGKSELHTLQLNNDNSGSERWKSVALARSSGVVVDGSEVTLVNGSKRSLGPVAGQGEFRVALYSHKILNPARISDKDKADGKKFQYFFLTRDPEPGKEVTGEYLTSAKEDNDNTGRLAVAFRFNAKGASLFHELTSANAPPSGSDREGPRRHLAIVLDGLIMSAPSLNAVIRDAGQISGNFTRDEVNNLVSILRSGALPATLKPQPVSENTMGAQLGDDTIEAGALAIGIAFLTILAFMLVYYRFAGFVACVALMANLILTIAFMVVVNATFTLPGLAGLVLMLAMAVDANILIYERLREERDRGASLQLALRNGYDRAFPTIIDTHLSSIFTAIVLYVVGNDQLKGFGISLTVGLLISLFTSLVMTRVMFQLWETKGWLKKLSMARLFSRPRINFMGIRKPVFIATVVTAGLGLGLFLARGTSTLNMDFVGGTVYTGVLARDRMMDTQELRARIEDKEARAKWLALATEPELVDPKDRTWKLTYQESDADRPRERYIRMTENVAPAEMRRRAEELPEPSIEMIYHSDKELSQGEKSRLFTVRTTEKSPELVSSSLGRLLGGDLEKIRLKDYTVRSVQLNSFNKPLPLDEIRGHVVKALRESKVIAGTEGKGPASTSALKALPLGGAALAAAGNVFDAADVNFLPREEGQTRGTWRSVTVTVGDAVDGGKLLAALLPLTGQDRPFESVQVSEAQLNLSAPAYVSQVKSLLDSAFKDVARQELSLREVRDPSQKGQTDQTDRYDRMALALPTPVDGEGFRKAMDTFATELPSRPPPMRLENFDSALAADMQQRALYAIVASWGAMLLYLWFRFGNWTFGLAAVLCLIHDVCMTLGIIAVCHYLYGWFGPVMGIRDFKLDLPAVASLLTLIGFSVNDTIVVFDRIREVRGKNPNLTPEMVNDSINQTLSRTILTSLTAWMVVLVLFIWGGEGVHLFAFVMVVGVVIGTFSSIFVASPLLLLLGEGAPKAGAPQPQRPREELTQPQEG